MGLNISDTPDSVQTIYDLDSNYTASNGRIVILAFAEPSASAIDANYNDAEDVLFGLQTILNNVTASGYANNLQISGILYRFSGSIPPDDFNDFVDDYVNNHGITYNISNNSSWGSSVAENFITNYGASVTNPCIYIISKHYIIEYKTHLGDHANIAAMISDIDTTVSALLAGPTIASTLPVAGTTLNSLGILDITYSEGVANADTAGNYLLSGPGQGGLNNNPSSSIQDLVDPNKYVLTMGGGAIGNGQLDIATSNITDAVFYTPVPLQGTSTPVSFTIDSQGPTLAPVTIVSDNAAPAFAKIADTITVSFTSSEDIQTPTVTIAGQAAAVTGGPQIWSATYTMQASDTEGVVSFEISAIQDTLGNTASNVTGTTDASSVTFSKTDLINPVASITSDISGTTGTSPIPVTITFSKEVVGFDAGDITTANCTVTNFIEITSQRVWTADIMPNSQGELSLYIDKDVVQDTLGNNNWKSQTFYITYTGAAINTAPPRVLSVKINPHLDQ